MERRDERAEEVKIEELKVEELRIPRRSRGIFLFLKAMCHPELSIEGLARNASEGPCR